MGITRDSIHKRRSTGGKKNMMQKKKKYNMGRQPANTRLGAKRIHDVRCRFGIIKRRALRLDVGYFTWVSQAMTKTAKILNVVYNASNNDYVRTNTLVKNAIIEVDASPFRLWFLKRFGKDIASKDYIKSLETEGYTADKKIALVKDEEVKTDAKQTGKEEAKEKTVAHQIVETQLALMKPSSTMKKKYATMLEVLKHVKFEDALMEGFQAGRLLACISSRPGQTGRVDGYLLEGKELDFYTKKVQEKKK
uniref:40S ribosomal protein S8 n=1 Tax=Entamoeba invadens TaxID=33085 RepID=S0B190_ENTIV|nr:40S ribosomal protein S8, putative [Entamoeba invadens]